MNWKNVDLISPYERNQNILNEYSFETLLLEISCNLRDINTDTVKKQFEISLNSKIQSAREVFNNNLNNIVKKAIEERKNGI